MLSDKIRNLAESAGIDVIGFADASAFPDYAIADSDRRDPLLSFPGAKSIIIAGVYIGGMTLPAWSKPQYGRTSRLYLSGFFLDVIRPLKPIIDMLDSQGYRSVICDSSTAESSSLPLKLAAIRAGLGWQGKHSLLISKKYGTFLALGGIITDAILEYNEGVEPNRCNACTECQKSCPQKALDEAYVLNKERCLSYLLQLEKFPENAKEAVKNRVGDCEICQDACSWNRRHLNQPLETKLTMEFRRRIKDYEKLFYLPDLSAMSAADYREKLGRFHTDIPYEVFLRNVMMASCGDALTEEKTDEAGEY